MPNYEEGDSSSSESTTPEEVCQTDNPCQVLLCVIVFISLGVQSSLVMVEREISMLLTMCISCCSFALKMSRVLFYLVQETSDHILFLGIQLKKA